MNTPEATTQLKIYHIEHLQSLTSALVNTWIKKHLKEKNFFLLKQRPEFLVVDFSLFIHLKKYMLPNKKSYL